MRVGVISDTHKLIRPEAIDALRGSDHIVHAGDLVAPEILDVLRAMAPLTVVRGNNDRGAWARALPETARVTLGGATFYVIHDVKELAVDPEREAIDVVVSGHSHVPKIERRGAVLFVNPGSAGPRRFKLPVCVARVTVRRGAATAELVRLD